MAYIAFLKLPLELIRNELDAVNCQLPLTNAKNNKLKCEYVYTVHANQRNTRIQEFYENKYKCSL